MNLVLQSGRWRVGCKVHGPFWRAFWTRSSHIHHGRNANKCAGTAKDGEQRGKNKVSQIKHSCKIRFLRSDTPKAKGRADLGKTPKPIVEPPKIDEYEEDPFEGVTAWPIGEFPSESERKRVWRSKIVNPRCHFIWCFCTFCEARKECACQI